MTAKAACLRIRGAQLKSFGWKTTGILQYLSFEAEKQEDFFFLKKTLMRRFESDARGDRKLFFGLRPYLLY